MMYVVPLKELCKMIELLIELWPRFEIVVDNDYAKITLLPYGGRRRKMPTLTHCIDIDAPIGSSGVVTVLIKPEIQKIIEDAVSMGAIAIVSNYMVPVTVNIIRSRGKKRLYIRLSKSYSGRTLRKLCIIG